ncbi:unnamed protein product [Rhizophagus irregularis]|uniref:Uncharacterized protein n=1 Tax=Rhizophagus irregularis TaxID=588596 RepID=A0A916E2I1_9GLOM|nr:unnamed protein product [Rhizophagus irregularis]CAB5351676.1 unnamed protein product [Rhizophagus irregularis]
MEKPSFVRPFGWASEVWKNQVLFGCSGGLPKYGKTKFRLAVRVGFRSIETPKIRSAVRVGFRSMEKPSFDQMFRRTGKFQDL